MQVIEATNVNDAYVKGRILLENEGELRDSRNGPVLETPFPVTTVFRNPWQRVLLCRNRDANPFFHFFEGMWMLCGHNDVHFPAMFNKRFLEYSDDGVTQAGAYGFRWRHHFGMDQLAVIERELQELPDSRRCVLQMWDPDTDLTGIRTSVDVPCNTVVYFKVDPTNTTLRMTVSCRSNDIIWGLYGANVVHFSFLHEYLAARLNLLMGDYVHISDSFHGYVDVLNKHPYGSMDVKYPVYQSDVANLYEGVRRTPNFLPLLREAIYQQRDEDWLPVVRDPFIENVVMPMRRAWNAYKDFKLGMDTCDELEDAIQEIAASDWREAVSAWTNKRITN